MNQIKINDMTALAEYRQYLYSNPRLTYLFFELTDVCNLSCLHCGSNCAPNNRTFLPFETLKNVLDRVSKAYSPRTIMICLSGGEPLLHPQFFRIADYIRTIGFSCGITTNATLIDEKAAAKIAEAGIQSVTVSLDGLEVSHNWLRNCKTAFRRALHGIRSLTDIKQKEHLVQITTVVHRKNIDELDSVFAFVAGLGVDSWRIINIEPIGRAIQNEELLLQRDDYLRLFHFIQEKRFDRNNSVDVTYGCSHYLTVPFERILRNNYFICGAGVYVASVLANGDICSCLDIERRQELIQGNVYRDDFVDVWEHRFKQYRTDRSSLCNECRNCDERMFCAGDSAHTWDYDKNEPLICMKRVLSEGEEDG